MLTCPRCKHKCEPTNLRCSKCGLSLSGLSDEASASSELTVQSRQYIKDYDISAQVELGGFARTYLAQNNGNNVVLEHLSIRHGDSIEEYAELFNTECKALSDLNHHGLPNIVEFSAENSDLLLLLDMHQSTSLVKIIYPESSGTTMQSVGRPVLPDLERLVRWSTKLAEILLYLHRQKPFPIIHRNLNSLTVCITKPEEEVRFLDFGLLNAFRAGNYANGGELNSLLSNPFINPDLLIDWWSDPRIDLYGFGRVLEFMLTGSVGESSGPISFPNGLLVDETRQALARIVERCCNTVSSDSYRNVTEILEDLSKLRPSAESAGTELISCDCGHSNQPSYRFCVVCGRTVHPAVEVADESESSFPVSITQDHDIRDRLLTNYSQNHFAPLQRFRLREKLDEVQSNPGFDELISLESLPLITKLPHQKEAALTALKRMRGRALLADEVGLGKTIEAGIILKELIIRQLVTSVLIFCPPQLLDQWQIELYEKFDEIFLVLGRDIDTSLAWQCPRLIAPYEIARQRFHAEEMLRHRYDLVILDEAHFLNDQEKNWRVIRIMKNLQKKYFLLLSATPMHNSLDEIYDIVTLLRPGHFEDLESFRQQFVDPQAPTRARNVETLRAFLREIMIRNNRQQVILDYPFPKRNASTVELQLEQEAVSFYKEFRDFYQQNLRNVGNRQFLLRMGEIVERLCSSPDAFREPINRFKRDRYAQKQLGQNFITRLESFAANYPISLVEPKIRQTKDLLRQFTTQGQKVLVFSQFNETTRHLYQRISRDPDIGERCILYDELEPDERRWKSLRDFRDSYGGVLFCPGEASEGYNLQFASVMINFDLPWDPMKLEQRIGRIQRIGGKQDVVIVNLVMKDTIEEEILRICEDKIRMFGEVIGQVEEILGNLRDEDDLRTMICNLYLDRTVEVDEGAVINAKEHLENTLDEAIKLSSVEQDTNALNMIYFDFSETED